MLAPAYLHAIGGNDDFGTTPVSVVLDVNAVVGIVVLDFLHTGFLDRIAGGAVTIRHKVRIGFRSNLVVGNIDALGREQAAFQSAGNLDSTACACKVTGTIQVVIPDMEDVLTVVLACAEINIVLHHHEIVTRNARAAVGRGILRTLDPFGTGHFP